MARTMSLSSSPMSTEPSWALGSSFSTSSGISGLCSTPSAPPASAWLIRASTLNPVII